MPGSGRTALADLEPLGDHKVRAQDAKRRDVHAVKLGQLRALAVVRIVKHRDGLDLGALMDEIEAGMLDAPERRQWSMNHSLAEIGIHDPSRKEG